MLPIRNRLQATFAEFLDHMVSIGGKVEIVSGAEDGSLNLTCSATVDGEVVTDVIRSQNSNILPSERLAMMAGLSKFDPMKEAKQIFDYLYAASIVNEVVVGVAAAGGSTTFSPSDTGMVVTARRSIGNLEGTRKIAVPDEDMDRLGEIIERELSEAGFLDQPEGAQADSA